MTDRIVKVLFAACLALLLTPFAALAQATHWVQVEAHATLRTAEEFAARYQQRIGNIAGFRIAGGWYALAVGPFATADEAEARRQQLLASRDIREDAYVTDDSIYGQQFWPAGGNALAQAPVTDATTDATTEATTAATAGDTPAAPEPAAQEPVVADAPAADPVQAEPALADLPEETVDEARRLEYTLERDDRMAIQIALQWFGFYRSTIDADFGPGTRAAIRNWQEAQGFDGSGYLTTRQRANLLRSYDSAVARYAFGPFRDEAAGIEMTLPLGMVAFDRHEAPFSHFSEINNSGMRVLLISQEGSQSAFYGLYEILQTLEVIPLDGPRERNRNSFTIDGRSATQRAHVEARYQNGQIKGWALLWTPAADADAELIMNTMRDSFRMIDGVLPSDMGATASTVARRDLVSGLEVRRPEHSRTGFFVDSTGTVVTTAEAVQGCGRVTIDEAYLANVRSVDAASGIAVLTPQDPLVPLAFAQFAATEPSLDSEVRVAGFSYQDTLTRPIVTFGRLSEASGLNGEADLRTLTLDAQPGDSGGPVFDGSGAVIGMLLPRPATPGRMLPEDVNFAVSAQAIQAALTGAGVSPSVSSGTRAMSPEMLTRMSGDLSVLVSCWN
ncbi:MAG: trypsin-like peptidase domain-containing protein [Rhodobacter sp.]|uniref:trypsin-like peptidase domain-containing protein n=1 Tax=Pararhodobacter sp. TaxID=2127056 RepID=UPI001D7D2902|nr:trypsin-like peptidase domain-containing protein [Pararhodobacter sp.]MCB1343741.1 trypsin-like peptidase domain-containing protein [Paracoccaceae bacterium]MCC0072726.1 trypsin-like peptidase domain-containing protein [Rhodobacter sp.]HPD90971.1 trypsin-like peptidase domain-containing protein [Pararhodobacter sp.]